MSGGVNTALQNNTRNIITQYFLTGVRINVPISNLEHNAFDLTQHTVNGQQIVTLDIFNPLLAMPGGFHEAPISAYWVPQGRSCTIPVTPTLSTFVFTPDFSGCSILVDQITPSRYCVYHVQGGIGHLNAEYLNIGRNHGLGLAGAMAFEDYGNPAAPRAFALLKHEQGRWWIYYQSQNGVGIGYNNGQFNLMGPQTVRGGGKIPIADLRREVPRTPPRINGVVAQAPSNPFYSDNIQRTGRSMLPNDTIW